MNTETYVGVHKKSVCAHINKLKEGEDSFIILQQTFFAYLFEQYLNEIWEKSVCKEELMLIKKLLKNILCGSRNKKKISLNMAIDIKKKKKSVINYKVKLSMQDKNVMEIEKYMQMSGWNIVNIERRKIKWRFLGNGFKNIKYKRKKIYQPKESCTAIY